MRTALCAPRDARASRGLIGMWTSHIGRTLAELEASTSFRREFTDKENVRRRNLLVMARLARAPHCGSIKPLSASPRAVLSEGERARFSHPVYKSSVEPGSAPRSLDGEQGAGVIFPSSRTPASTVSFDDKPRRRAACSESGVLRDIDQKL